MVNSPMLLESSYDVQLILHVLRANHPMKYAHPQLNMDIYKYSFLPRTIPQWNNLQIENSDSNCF